MKKLIAVILLLLSAISIVLGSSIAVYTAITQVAGLAVAQTPTKWNSVKDAAAGDNVTSGILGTGLYLFDGTNFDRARGDATYGLDVDVTRIQGSIAIAGNKTPADNYTNPTDAINTYSLTAVWDGTGWDRWTGSVITNTATTMTTGQVSITDAAGGTLIVALNTSRKEVMIQNIGINDVYCGNSGVTVTTGFKVTVNSTFIDDRFTGAYYCITGTGLTSTVAYREVQ